MNLFEKRKTPVVGQIGDYLHYCEFVKRLTEQSLRTKRIIITRFVRDTDITDFQKLTNAKLNDWHSQLVKEGKVGKTVNNYQETIVTCLKYLGRHGYKLKFDFDMVERAHEEQRESTWFTPAQIEMIKAACIGPKELLVISFLFDSLLRISELRMLRVEDISGATVKVIQGKGRKDRTTFIGEDTEKLLRRWLTLNDISTGYIFPSPDRFGQPLTVTAIRAAITPPIRRAGFDKGSAHSLRHSKATDIRNKGGDIVFVQSVLGHSDIKTTRRYVHVTEEQLRQEYHQFA